MKIFNTQMTKRLPKIISECQGSVFMVLDDGKRYPVNESETTIRIFEKFWDNIDRSPVELICENTADTSKLCKMLFSCV